MAERLRIWPFRRSVRPIAALVGLAIVVTLGVCAGFVVVSAEQLKSALAEAQQARDVDDGTEGFARAMMEAELNQRELLLTGNDADFSRFESAAARARAALGRLAAEVPQNAWLGPRLEILSLLAQTHLSALETVARARIAGPRAALPLTRDVIVAGQTDAAAIRAAIAEISQEATVRRQGDTVALERGREQVVLGLTVAAVAGALLVGVATFGVLLSRRRRLAAQDSLRREGERLAAMVNHIRDGVAVFDPQDRLVLWNTTFFPTTGLPPELGRRGASFARFAAAAADWFPPLLDEPRPRAEPVVAEMHRQGRVLEVWRSALPDGGQILAVADISKRVEAEQMARQAQKMDALGQLTGGIAHDMNNLLQVISANLEQLAGGLPAEGGLRTRLDSAMAGVARGANLTRHLLAFARRQPLASEVIVPGELLEGTAELLRRTLGEMYEVRLALDEREALWTIRTDPQQLENAVLNLALNARDAMPEGGRLVIIVTNRVLDETYAAHHAEVTPGQYVMIAVADTGKGMSAEQIVRAVEPFYTTKGTGHGTGLGLSMVYGLVRQSGGHLHIDSAPGEGTTVRLYIPRTHIPLTTPVRPQQPTLAANELVLVVEDDRAVRAAAVSSLRDLGYRTLEAENADTALELLRTGAKPDVLFTDVVMPGSVGATELARAARTMLPGIAVLFTSGYTDNPSFSTELLEPGARLLRKPWTRSVLAEAIRQALRAALAERTRQSPAPRLRVLLVEDEPLVRETTAELLAAMGHSVRATGSAAEARLAASDADLVIADAGLPDADGARLVAEFLKERPNLPTIVVSGREAHVLDDPGVIWLEKPFDEAQLRQAITGACAKVEARAA
ncbi:MAG TPA: response regulator [Acetobacteraceae bacterium]|nr:response regulator [Acetobacteraceae bacterium]